MVNREVLEEYEKMGNALAEMDTNRGGSSNQLKGFVAEVTNTTEANIDRIERGIVAREHVINDNGPADAIIKYASGQTGRSIQDKCGYTFSDYKKMIKEGKYDGQILRINSDHPMFEKGEQVKELKLLAKEHGIKIQKSLVSGEFNKQLADKMSFEGNIRTRLNMDATPSMTAKVVTRQKQAEYIASETKKDIDNAIGHVNESIYSVAENIGGERFAQINQESMKAAVGAMSVAAITTIVDNSVKVANGEKTKEEAIKDATKTITEAGFVGYSINTISQITDNVINKTIQQGSHNFITGNNGNDFSVVVVKSGQQFAKYCKDEITMDEMFENTSEILTEQIISFVGGVIFNTLIPGTEIVGRYVATVLYQSSKRIKMNKQQYSGYMDFISAVERNARKQIDMYRVSFLETVKKSNDEMTKRVVNAFDLLDEGYWNNDVHKATMGISGLADVIGAKEELDQINMTFLEENWIGG